MSGGFAVSLNVLPSIMPTHESLSIRFFAKKNKSNRSRQPLLSVLTFRFSTGMLAVRGRCRCRFRDAASVWLALWMLAAGPHPMGVPRAECGSWVTLTPMTEEHVRGPARFTGDLGWLENLFAQTDIHAKVVRRKEIKQREC